MKYLKIIIIVFVIICLLICINFYINTKPMRDLEKNQNILNEYIDNFKFDINI